MRIFLAGATGVLGLRLVPLLVAAGHQVIGMTRTAAKCERLRTLGAEPVVCDVYDLEALQKAVSEAKADLVMHQLTDLPDDVRRLPESRAANSRIRREGTRNLLAAARSAGVRRFVAQSVAWPVPGDGGQAVAEHEKAVLGAGGVVVRYGQFYGPGTFYEAEPPDGPRIHIDEAARRTLQALDQTSGIVIVTEDERDADQDRL